MKSGIQLIGNVLLRRTPPRALFWALLNVAHRVLKTGNRRYEFERLYAENPDPWDYRSREYEQRKYGRVLDTALRLRRRAGGALEIGCSVGVFTQMLAPHFGRVTGTDIAGEALRLAAIQTRAARNVRYVRATLQTLNLGETYDAIFCAEVLYYIAKALAPAVCETLAKHLSSDGILLTVSQVPDTAGETYSLQDWDTALNDRFERIFMEDVPDSLRPYRIAVYARRS